MFAHRLPASTILVLLVLYLLPLAVCVDTYFLGEVYYCPTEDCWYSVEDWGAGDSQYTRTRIRVYARAGGSSQYVSPLDFIAIQYGRSYEANLLKSFQSGRLAMHTYISDDVVYDVKLDPKACKILVDPNSLIEGDEAYFVLEANTTPSQLPKFASSVRNVFSQEELDFIGYLRWASSDF